MFLINEFRHLQIQLQDIVSATDNFSSQKLIGHGGFGQVYKGELSMPDGRTLAAFKRLDCKFGQGNTEFWKEIMMLSKCKHENLITLTHFCFEDKEMILVYEFASRGSLDRYLSDTSFTWIQRLKICVGAARGLSYLHDPMETKERVLHRDIKSSNILIDEQWSAKVSDFGLSKVGPANQPHTFLVTNVVGTFGYCDPSYHETGVLSKESDVYSFGVVLFEVMSGRLCCEYQDGQLKRILVPMWKQCFDEKRLGDIILPGLRGQIDLDCLKTFSTIAYKCLHKDHKKRPTMIQVMKELEVALRQQNGENYEGTAITIPRPTKTPRLELRFRAQWPDTFFVGKNIRSEDGSFVNIMLFDIKSNKIVTSGALSSLKVEIVALDGDFSADDDEDWSEKHFDSKVVHPTTGSKAVVTMTGYSVTLENGVGYLSDFRFIHTKRYQKSIKLMIGARAKGANGVRIREAASQAFVLKDRHGENSYRKRNGPNLFSSIWTLTRKGTDHKLLASQNICIVKDFVQMYVSNQPALRQILCETSDEGWEKIIKRAETCVLDDKFYKFHYGAKGNGIMLDSGLRVVGVTFDDQSYLPLDKLSVSEMQVMEALKQEVYTRLDGMVPVHDPSIFEFLIPMFQRKGKFYEVNDSVSI